MRFSAVIIQAYIQEFFHIHRSSGVLNKVKNTVNTSLDTGGLKKDQTLKWQNLNFTITTLCYSICSNVAYCSLCESKTNVKFCRSLNF